MQSQSDASFAIIIPCYNDADVLGRSLNSVAQQTHPVSEIIVVNDGSNDETETLVRDYQNKHPGTCSYHYQTNSGVSVSRNKGIELAGSDYLIFLDADDELHPTALETYLSTLQNSPDQKWLIGDHQWERNDNIKSRRVKLPGNREKRFKQYITKKLHVGNISNMCFAKEVFTDIRFPPQLRFGEDFVVFALLFTLCEPVVTNTMTALSHRRNTSLRTRASLMDLIESQVHAHLFKHPLLAQKYLRFAALHWAQNCQSIAKRAYKEKDYLRCSEWYREMISAYPRYALDIRMSVRFLKANRRSQGFETTASTNSR
ncbi:MAG: glycosyltransferase [Pseudomonadales bacterium]